MEDAKNCLVSFSINDKEYPCPVQLAIGVIGGKWKGLILYQLSENRLMRYGELRRQLPKITHKMLTQQLRELEGDGIVHRKVYAEVPPRVEYSLTEMGRELEPILESMRKWGLRFKTPVAG